MEKILTEAQERLLRDERELLTKIATALHRTELGPEEQRALTGSIRQLDELFLLVVVGEFNAGKSAFINALIGASVLAEGVTPTTSRIHLLRHGDSSRREVDEGREELTAPVEILSELTVVDTPGTNALDRRHEAITDEFVPRADLVLFVTSADRPFSESERAFLERIRTWGKKVVVVLNKIDLLAGREEIDEVVGYIRDHAKKLLGFEPEVFPISARRAAAGRVGGDAERLAASGLPAIEHHLRTILDDAERVRLKLANPLGVGRNLVQQARGATTAALDLLAGDLATLDDVEQQLTVYTEDVEREFRLRLADIDNVLHGLESRGITFFDDTVRLGRLPDLLKRERLRQSFEETVVADAPAQVERRVESLIDWLVQSDLDQWQAVVRHVAKRRERHADRVVGEVDGRFEIDRRHLLETVGRAAREAVEGYDTQREASRMADDVQGAVAGTAALEAGAIGVGATVALVASGSAADVTGLVAAGVLAALGLFVLPHRRRKAKRELREKIATMRVALMAALERQFRTEAEQGQQRIRDTIAPYTRFVRAERDRLGARADELDELLDRIAETQARIDAL